MSKILEEDSESDLEFKTDTEYAKNYDRWRKKEELNKLKTKYGEELDSQESSSESEDDEVGAELTDKVEKDFFKTLAYLKNKDPRIYDENVKFFDDDYEVEDSKPKKDKQKPMYLKDYERNLILEKQGVLSDDENSNDERPKSPTYVEQQNLAKDNLKQALNSVDEKDEDQWGGIFSKRNKTEEETDKEEQEYKLWLAGQKAKLNDDEIQTELKPLKDYWNKPDLEEDEKFLRDYILNKKFLDKEDESYIPTYDEIIHDSDGDLSNDEETIEKQDDFEHKYNFRFEEPDEEFIKRYPRTIESSLRRKDDRRKVKRQEIKERKKKEKEEKKQDLKQLRELKRREIEEKLEKLKEITGNTALAFDDNDLDGDFDPEKHDQRMQELFNEGFYGEEEGEQKPVFPDIDEELEIENYERFDDDYNEDHVPHCEDEDFNMDADYHPSSSKQTEITEETKHKKKRKRKSKFAKAVSQPKPKFDPNDKNYEEYFDEYYKLDCEDFIGDIPCRFKYRKVVPNDFGLTVEEILMAKERELNKWCSLKKAVQNRPEHIEKYDQIAYKKKAQNINLKRKILPSLFVEESEENEKNASKEGNLNMSSNDNEEVEKNVRPETTNKRRKKNSYDVNATQQQLSNNDSNNSNLEITTESELTVKENASSTNEISKTKNKKKKKKKAEQNTQQNEDSITNTDKTLLDKAETPKNKKKNKKTSNGQSHVNAVGGESSLQKLNKTKRKRKGGDINKGPNKKFKKATQDSSISISDQRLAAYGIKPKKFKNKLKYQHKN